ncbi:hypothetical protein WMW72_26080 [Paenibacillus filicis]|uniref:ATP-grasp domain-containing protein n=1 Tax=Paenibacillus filicis TaxID=669464 RepID=A0ABU9DUF9_9BACL
MYTERGKVLLTGGRAPAALELARQLAADGWHVAVAESTERHLCRASKAVKEFFRVPPPVQGVTAYIEALLQIVQQEKIDWLIPTCEEIFYISAGLERLSPYCRVMTVPLGQLGRLHSKWAFIRRVEEMGLAVPATVRLVPGDEASYAACLEALEQDDYADGVVLKPEFSRFAAKVRRFERLAEARRFIRKLHDQAVAESKRSLRHTSFSTEHRETDDKAGSDSNIPGDGSRDGAMESHPPVWVVQRLIRGRALCTYGVAHDGQLRAHGAYESSYTAGQGATIYFESIAHTALLEWVKRFVSEEGFSGQIAFDFIEDGQGVLYPLECNPRATSGVHLFRPGDGLAQALLPDSRSTSYVSLIQPRPMARAMLALPMLAYGLRADLSWTGLSMWLRRFRQAGDVVYRRSDPAPFFEQARMLWGMGRAACAQGLTLMEVSTADIEWNGGPMR